MIVVDSPLGLTIFKANRFVVNLDKSGMLLKVDIPDLLVIFLGTDG